MQIWLAGPLLGGDVQDARHLVELLAAFGLAALIGMERTVQGKSAGLLLLAIAVVVLHFVSALAFSAVERQLAARLRGTCSPNSTASSPSFAPTRNRTEFSGRRGWRDRKPPHPPRSTR